MNEKCNLVTVLLLCCLIFPGNAQEFNWQDLVNRKQYAAVIAHADIQISRKSFFAISR